MESQENILPVRRVPFARQLLLQHSQEFDPALVGVLLLEAAVFGLLGEPGEGHLEAAEEDDGRDVLALVHFFVKAAHGGGDAGGDVTAACGANCKSGKGRLNKVRQQICSSHFFEVWKITRHFSEISF